MDRFILYCDPPVDQNKKITCVEFFVLSMCFKIYASQICPCIQSTQMNTMNTNLIYRPLSFLKEFSIYISTAAITIFISVFIFHLNINISNILKAIHTSQHQWLFRLLHILPHVCFLLYTEPCMQLEYDYFLSRPSNLTH